MQKLLKLFFGLILGFWLLQASAQEPNYILGPGDVIRVTVFNNADLQLETRVSEAGLITFPLIGSVKVGGLTPSAAERKLASKLESGGYLKKPQVNILVVQFQSKLVSVLGSVLKPGRYPMERETSLSALLALVGGVTPDGSDIITITDKDGVKKEYDLSKVGPDNQPIQNMKLVGGETVFVNSKNIAVMGQVLRPGKYSIVSGVRTVSDFLSMAGGVVPTGSDIITVITKRDGKTARFQVDVDDLFTRDDPSINIEMQSGDSIYVPQAPMVYVYGEVQRPGSFKIQRNMTVMQVLSQGGGVTARGTQRGIKLNRRNTKGETVTLYPELTDLVQDDDVIYVKESLF
jgi:polysaccharide export outer membrane protein